MSDNWPQNATDLTPAQEIALVELLAGKSITQTAKKAKVDRSTIYRWLAAKTFQKEFHRRREAFRSEVHGRLLALANQATDCVEKAIKSGDVKTATVLLKSMGLMAIEASDSGPANQFATPRFEHSEPITMYDARERLQKMIDEIRERHPET